MRVGLSFDPAGDGTQSWSRVTSEIAVADGLGFDSVWISEARDGPADIPAPALFLTHVARRTSSLLLHVAGRRAGRDSPVRVAEEVAVLDLFSKGRAGICFAAAGRQGRPPAAVHELVEFVAAAWASDAFRYRGDHIRFPTHTGDDAPPGVSTPDEAAESATYVPQWERGPAMPDFSAVTPKPLQARPPLAVEIHDDETLEWAAANGVSGFAGADLPTAEAVERLSRYRAATRSHGTRWSAVEATLERRITLDGEGDPHDDAMLRGTPREILDELRRIRAATGISHLVWRRTPEQVGRADLLYRFAGEVQLLLQA